jgi:hypothetical protein
MPACGVPLAPGYHIKREAVQARFDDRSAPVMHVSASWQLENTGTTSLDVIEIDFPKDSLAGRENLQIAIDGRVVQEKPRPAASPESSMTAFDLPFNPAWEKRQKRQINITFDLTKGSDAVAELAPSGFFFDSSAWFPVFRPPKHFLAKGEERADPTDLTLITPPEFVAISAGRPRGSKRNDSQVERQFRIRAADLRRSGRRAGVRSFTAVFRRSGGAA